MPQGRLTQLIAVVVCLALLGLSGLVSADLTASAGRHKLTYTERAEEGDPPQVALGIAMGAFRGLFVNILWIRANELKEEGKYYEAVDLARAITRLQPRFPQVWAFHAWNMAYNISVTTNTETERWNWVSQGIDLLRMEGVKHNPTDMVVHKELAWLFLHKVQAFADDAHWYYKLQLAGEWHELLGPPPMPDPGNNKREVRIALFEEWLQPIVEAPETLDRVIEENPKVGELVDRLAALDIDPTGQQLLKTTTRVRMARASAVWPELRDSGDQRFRDTTELVHDPEFAEALEDLLAFTRRKVLIEDFNMEPRRMLRYTSTYGPLDWRHPASHALYWGQKGVEGGMTRIDAVNLQDYDFINTDRLVVQSIQELWRTGGLWFDYNAMMLNRGDRRPFYLGIPDPAYIPVYGEILRDVIERSYYDGEERAYSSYSAGYENMMKDAIRFIYRRGDVERARQMKNELANFDIANLNDPRRAQWLAQDIDRFVRAELENRLGSPSVALQEIVGSLNDAILTGLIGGDDEIFESSIQYAKEYHAAYTEQQVRESAAGTGRMEFLDRRFDFVVGQVFANILPLLQIDLAQRGYYNAPPELRKWAYDQMVMRFKPLFDDEEGNAFVDGRSFDTVFPEPEGMPAFRAMLDREFGERGRDLDQEQK